MANQTLVANQNYDDAAIAGLANGEGITLAGFNLLCDSDSRWGQQAAVHGNIAPSATLGGDILWDSTRVWWMAYDAPSGNVPALGTCGVQNCTGGTSGATGEFLGIWSSIPGAPVAAAAAIPATGWVKFRSKVGTFVDNETVTLSNGATLTVNSATGGQRGWLHWVGQAGGICNTVRLGTATATGDWFELGVTNGSDDQTFAIPVLDHVPFVEIQTGVGSSTWEKWVNPGFRWGQSVQMVATDIRGKMFGQWKEVTATSVVSSAVVTMTDTTGFLPGMPIGYPSDGTAHVADGAVIVSIVPNTSITMSKVATVAGSFTFRSPLGTITLARRATNACGYKPASGLRVRCPNAWMSTADLSSWTGNQNWYTSATSRWEITAAGGGIVNFDKVNCLWYHNTSGAYQWVMTNCGVSGGAAINVGNTTLPLIFDDNAGGGDCPATATILNANNLPNGSSIQRNGLVRINNRAIADRVVTSSDAVGITFNSNYFMHFGGEGTVDRAFGDNRMIEMSRWVDSTIDNNTFIGGSVLINTMLRCTVNNHVFADRMNGATTSTNGLNAVILQTQCIDCVVKNFSLLPGLTNVHPYAIGVVIQTGCVRCKARDIGTPAAPFNCGSANQTGYVVQVTSSNDCEINRIYSTAARFSVFSTLNTVYRMTCDNIWGSGAINYIMYQIDSVCRGMYGTPAANAVQSVYGSHWTDSFPSATTGLVRVFMNEPTTSSASQMAIAAGTPAFTAGGQISMPTAGDQVIATMDYFAIGHTSLANIAPTLTGTLTGNMSYEFQYDFGSGWNGSWLTLDATNLSATGAITPATGFKVKFRITTVTPDPTNALTSIRIDTVTDATSQVMVYPYKTDAAITINTFVSGSSVRLYNVTKVTELLNTVVSATSYSFNYYNGTEIAAGDVVQLCVRKLGKETITLTTVATAMGGSFLFAQLNQPQCTSTTPTDVTIDYVNKKIRATGARAGFTAQELIDIIGAAQATIDGMRMSEFAGISGNVTLSPGVAVGFTVDLLGWQTSWASGSVAQATLTGGNIVGGIAGDVVEDVAGGPQITVNVSAAATMNTANVPTAAQVAAAVRAELAVEIARIDVAISTRLASAGYTAPDNAGVTAIKAKTDNLPVAPAAVGDIPTAATNAAAVRTNLTTELGHIDVAISSRLASASYVAPDNSDIATIVSKLPTAGAKIAGEGTTAKNLDQVTADLSTVAKTTELNAAVTSIKGASNKDLTQVFNNTPSIDPATVWAYATRTLTADTAAITAIKAKTDNLPVAPAAVGDIPTAATNASAVRTNLTTELGRIVATISTRATPVNVTDAVTSIKGASNKDLTQVFNNTPSIDPSSVWAYATRTLTEAAGLTPTQDANLTAIKNKTNDIPGDVRTNLTTELARIDVAISTRTGIPQSMPPLLTVIGETDMVMDDATAILEDNLLDASFTLDEL